MYALVHLKRQHVVDLCNVENAVNVLQQTGVIRLAQE